MVDHASTSSEAAHPGSRRGSIIVSPSEAVPIVGVPHYPNCVKWSQENLLAVGAGHLVTILNPASLGGPRGFIPISTSPVFRVGTVRPEDLQAPSLFEYCLARDPRPGVRSVDWSPQGLAQNGGCLLAVCTTDSRVKVYRAPFCDFQSEWVEIIDLSEILLDYLVDNGFKEAGASSARLASEENATSPPQQWGFQPKRKACDDGEPQHRKVQKSRRVGGMDIEISPVSGLDQHPLSRLEQGADKCDGRSFSSCLEKDSRVEVLHVDDGLQYWVGAWIVEITDQEVLVRLDQPQYGAMQEWVPLHHQRTVFEDSNTDRIADAVGGNQFLLQEQPRIRPPVIMDALQKSILDKGSLEIGESVEAWLNQRWQRGTVGGLEGSGVIVKFSNSVTNTIMDLDKLRLAPSWNGRQWIRKTTPTVSIRIGAEGNSDDAHVAITWSRGQHLTPNDSRDALDPSQIKNQIPNVECADMSKLKPILDSEKNESWRTEADGDMILGHEAEQENQSLNNNVDYERGFKAKQGSLVKDTQKNVKQVTDTEDTHPLTGYRVDDMTIQKGRKSNKDILIRAPEFAARSELLTPLVLSWSSSYQDSLMGKSGIVNKFVLLGAGMKSGRVSFWRMSCPPSYSIDHAHIPASASFLGFLFAHESWVISLSWASFCNFDPSKLNPHAVAKAGRAAGETLLLATGSSDGSVKLWAGLCTELTGPPSLNHSAPFMFLREVIKVDCVPVTSLALIVPQSGDKALLAVGKGSGSVAVWELSSSGHLRQVCLQHAAHEQMLTGFSWTYDGCCLYSCGQDSLKRWVFSHDQLLPLPLPDGTDVFPSHTAPDLCNLEALESFFGVALSNNSLALAVVRGISCDLLDQMYQARSQKGIVQLFWLGSELVDFSEVNGAITANNTHAQTISRHEMICWELNIVAALEHLQDPGQALVLWDVIAVLLSLKERVGVEHVDSILSKWLSSWVPGQHAVNSCELLTGSFQKAIPDASCRKLQLLNIICRRVFLCQVKAEGLSACSSQDPGESINDNQQLKLWMDLMNLVEHDLRQRLVYFNLSTTTEGNTLEDTAKGTPVEMQLSMKWVLSNSHSVFPQLVKLTTQLLGPESELLTKPGSSSVEECNFCDSSVPFESPEMARCGSDDVDGASRHQLQRCSVSMQVCKPVCLWHCACCERVAIKQASSLFFHLSSRGQEELSHSLVREIDTIPFCPFCGIMMYRLLPNFLLTPSLV